MLVAISVAVFVSISIPLIGVVVAVGSAIVALTIIGIGGRGVYKAGDKVAEFSKYFSVVGIFLRRCWFLHERWDFVGCFRGKLEQVGVVLGENVLDLLADNFLDLLSVVCIALGRRSVLVPFIIFDFGGEVY